MTQTRGINQTKNRVKESYTHRWWIQSSMRFWKVQQGGHKCIPAQEGSLQHQAPGFVGGTISHFRVLAGLPMCELGPTNNMPTLCVSPSVDRSPHQG